MLLLFRKTLGKIEWNWRKKGKKIPPGYPRTNLKIPGFFHRLNLGIFYPGIFQESKSWDFLVPGFFDPGISRDIPGPRYPVDIPILYVFNKIFHISILFYNLLPLSLGNSLRFDKRYRTLWKKARFFTSVSFGYEEQAAIQGPGWSKRSQAWCSCGDYEGCSETTNNCWFFSKLFYFISIKGQLISKRFFEVLDFLQKTNENNSHSSKNAFIHSFFGGNRWPQKHFRN